jgi:hypothetical protein
MKLEQIHARSNLVADKQVKSLLKSSHVSWERKPNSLGIVPVSALVPQKRNSSVVRSPNSVGIGPLKRFSSNEQSINGTKRSQQGGNTFSLGRFTYSN